jgi:hypothetical protein
MFRYTRRLARPALLAVCVGLASSATSTTLRADPVVEDIGSTILLVDPFAGTWKLSATPDEDSASLGAKPFDDEIQFHNTLFTTSSFAMMGFPMVEYTIAGTTTRTFTITTVSEDWGTLNLAGHVDQDGILRSTLVWSRPDGHTYRYAVRGERP